MSLSVFEILKISIEIISDDDVVEESRSERGNRLLHFKVNGNQYVFELILSHMVSSNLINSGPSGTYKRMGTSSTRLFTSVGETIYSIKSDLLTNADSFLIEDRCSCSTRRQFRERYLNLDKEIMRDKKIDNLLNINGTENS